MGSLMFEVVVTYFQIFVFNIQCWRTRLLFSCHMWLGAWGGGVPDEVDDDALQNRPLSVSRNDVILLRTMVGVTSTGHM